MAKYPNITAGRRLDAALLSSMLPEYVHKTANTDRTATTTLADDPDLTIGLEASAKYCVEFFIYYGGSHNDDSAGDGDFVTSWSVPTDASGLKSVIGPGIDAGTESGAASVDQIRLGVHQLATNVAYACVRDQTGLLQLAYEQGIVTTDDAGPLTLQWAQEDSDATATRVAIGSFMRVTRIG